jgi:mRNA interferase RelE/StbE
MLYHVNFTQYAYESLPGIHPDVKKLIKDALKELMKNPYLGKDLQEELAGFQSYRLKRYRIIYKTNMQSKTIMVYFVGHRRNVYELFTEMVAQSGQSN